MFGTMIRLSWQCKEFSALSNEELYCILRLRAEVFIVEQECIYQDIDNSDQVATHVLGRHDDKLVCYARLLPPGEKYPAASIGRVVTSQRMRRGGHGKQLMARSIAYCEEKWPRKGLTISAQQYLESFYQEMGFVTASSPYLEDGIAHVRMTRST